MISKKRREKLETLYEMSLSRPTVVAAAVKALEAGKELLSDPKRWTQGTVARAADGAPTGARAEAAVAWCAIGSLWKVTRGDEDSVRRVAVAALEATGSQGICAFSDKKGRKLKDVLSKFDEAKAYLATKLPKEETNAPE